MKVRFDCPAVPAEKWQEWAEIENSNDLILTAWKWVVSQAGEQWEDFDENNRLDPTAYRMLKADWIRVSELLQRFRRDDFDKIGAALDWMNVGPSGY